MWLVLACPLCEVRFGPLVCCSSSRGLGFCISCDSLQSFWRSIVCILGWEFRRFRSSAPCGDLFTVLCSLAFFPLHFCSWACPVTVRSGNDFYSCSVSLLQGSSLWTCLRAALTSCGAHFVPVRSRRRPRPGEGRGRGHAVGRGRGRVPVAAPFGFHMRPKAAHTPHRRFFFHGECPAPGAPRSGGESWFLLAAPNLGTAMATRSPWRTSRAGQP